MAAGMNRKLFWWLALLTGVLAWAVFQFLHGELTISLWVLVLLATALWNLIRHRKTADSGTIDGSDGEAEAEAGTADRV